MSSNQRRFIYNCDGDNLLIHDPYPIQPEQLVKYVDEVADTGVVTTFFMSCHIGMDMNYEGEHADLAGSHMTLERRKQVEESETFGHEDLGVRNLLGLVEAGHDPLGIILDRSIERRMETFITFRLNEVHCVDEPDSWLLSRFWNDHPEWHVGTPGDPLPDLHTEILGPVHPMVAGWIPGGLDFSVQEVRDRKVSQIAELCDRYPIDGIDLDFQRFPIYFRFGEEEQNAHHMTDFMREVRSVTNAAGDKRGRPLQLCARIMAKPEHNTGLGLDPVAWASEGLLDFVTVSHYLRNEYDLPINEYRRLLPADLPLYASVEWEGESDRYREIARPLWRDGVDGLMMFNFFASRNETTEPPFFILPELADREKMMVDTDSA
jgi:hypothetical protein